MTFTTSHQPTCTLKMSDYQKIKGRTWAVAFFFPALDDENVKQKFRWSPSLFGASSTSHFVPLWTLKTDKKQKGVVYITFTRSCCVCVFSPSWSPIYIYDGPPPPYYSSRQLYRRKKWRLYMHSAPERLSCVCVCVSGLRVNLPEWPAKIHPTTNYIHTCAKRNRAPLCPA